MGIFIEAFCNVLKSLLTCCIPDVKTNGMTLDLCSFDFEINTDGGEEIRLECVLAVAHEDACFADTGVADDKVFKSKRLFFHGFNIIIVLMMYY